MTLDTHVQGGTNGMCMSCGCGKLNERHKEGDIILDDMKKAAKNSNIDIEKAADNIHDAARKARAEGTG